tara:strand:+ start:231409 stop:232479 length:1071 start_codon:yes stop_codon:yes gene_type:complete
MISAGKHQSHSAEWLFCKRWACISALALAFVVSTACSSESVVEKLSGATMGTTWHVSYVPSLEAPDAEQLQGDIAAALEDINAALSTYREQSEISRFNRVPPQQWFDASPAFFDVLQAALELGDSSEGAYDVTVGPLVDLWGFGAAPQRVTAPAEHEITLAMERVGQGSLTLDRAGRRILKQAQVAVDLSSIAKGYAVDRVAELMHSAGVVNYLVEVGGEMRMAGLSQRGDAWRIAIEQPDSATRSMAAGLALSDVAVATSGDYRNFFEQGGIRYSHSIDPRTGYPVAHDLVSVTVVHPTAMLADGWATALTVLGFDKAWALASAEGLAVYFIRRSGDEYVSAYTEPLTPYLVTAQ